MDESTNNPNVPKQSGLTGSLVATAVVLAIIIVGALYFWSQRSVSTVGDSTIDSINTQSSSDSAAAIEADLNTTDVNSVDDSLNQAS